MKSGWYVNEMTKWSLSLFLSLILNKCVLVGKSVCVCVGVGVGLYVYVHVWVFMCVCLCRWFCVCACVREKVSVGVCPRDREVEREKQCVLLSARGCFCLRGRERKSIRAKKYNRVVVFIRCSLDLSLPTILSLGPSLSFSLSLSLLLFLSLYLFSGDFFSESWDQNNSQKRAKQILAAAPGSFF